MPPLHSRATRELVKQRNVIEGPRKLHRGIHININETTTKQYRSRDDKPHADHRELLVHHQKINEDLQDIYARTAALHSTEATMEQRIEESWRQFERIGGKRPVNHGRNAQNGQLCVSPSAMAYADRLAQVSQEKKELRAQSSWERDTRGEAVDYRNGSALHAAKDKRIQLFQRRQLKRAHMLRRMGDPTPLKQSGNYDMSTGTFRVFSKTIRKVQREVAHDDRISAVHDRRKGSRSKWDVNDEGNVNRPDRDVAKAFSKEWNFDGRGAAGRKRKRDG